MNTGEENKGRKGGPSAICGGGRSRTLGRMERDCDRRENHDH